VWCWAVQCNVHASIANRRERLQKGAGTGRHAAVVLSTRTMRHGRAVQQLLQFRRSPPGATPVPYGAGPAGDLRGR